MSSAPAAESHEFKSASKYACARPAATHASMSAADPTNRTVRTLGMSAAMPRREGPMEFKAGGDPANTTASPNTAADSSVLAVAKEVLGARATERRSPLQVAPWPSTALNISSMKGSYTTATAGCPLSAQQMETPLSVRPLAKLVVPSIGSTTHTQESFLGPLGPLSVSSWPLPNTASRAFADAACPAATLSSPRNWCAGKAACTHASMARWACPSTSVSRSLGFALVFRTSAPLPARIKAPALRAASSAQMSTAFLTSPSTTERAVIGRRWVSLRVRD
mmetsp:Transcript_66895/g.134838  ORF Transcript_66895/g.134838 Transcript_66895/m.134838 type:complete len:279 (+) Transcript_66895:553-1389(+)